MDDLRIIERTTGMNDIKVSARKVQVYYGDNHAIKPQLTLENIGDQVAMLVHVNAVVSIKPHHDSSDALIHRRPVRGQVMLAHVSFAHDGIAPFLTALSRTIGDVMLSCGRNGVPLGQVRPL